LECIGDGVLVVEPDGRVAWMNPAAELLTGWSLAEGRTAALERVLGLQALAPGTGTHGTIFGLVQTWPTPPIRVRRRDGTERWVSGRAWPRSEPGVGGRGWVVVLRDVTVARRRESEARLTERLEAWGRLATGIAHDFNNALMVILGNISMAKLQSCGSVDLKERLEQAGQGCLRARDLMQRLQVLAPGAGLRKRTVPLEDVVRPALETALRGSGVRAEFALGPGLWPVEADVLQLIHAFQQLGANAAQAMTDGGVLRVRAENATAESWNDLPLEPGAYVRCVLADAGPGIEAETLPHVFDPFFTTKRGAHGLGLTAVLAIVKRHGGIVRVHSPAGSGTTVELFIPAAGPHPAGGHPAQRARGPLAGTRILVMDDQPLVGELARGLLRNLGCDVTVARDGQHALELYRRARGDGRPYSVAILDLMVPGGMGGEETVRRLIEIDPGVRAVVSSGYSTDPAMIEPARFGFRAAVAKPYAVEDLARVLEAVLEPQARGLAGGDGASGTPG
jgi:signal transduction histidine kinase/ActR/RegA family two-component response regulator